ncbi:hypothetical protein [Methylophaga sp. OBS4]|uniref:hypothetical protein n=1 Tax=Methylophaga sp. OBS4 TaxID=2991935 RepID=UPI00225097A6|nr:hypothetical protein [Methylophaga sp. OBS4]MCX4187190.1 hypothetical protein [Methylophaga sp. OBS4]
MSNTLIETLKNITEMVTTASYYLESEEGKKMLPHGRDQLIEYVTSLLASFQDDGFKRTDIKALVAELLTRKETDDHGWFIDINSSTHDQVVFIHPQRIAPHKSLVLPKSHALLPFNLIA